MSRILAIDYGLKRTGIAVTDSLQMIATAVETIDSYLLLDYLKNYTKKNDVVQLVIGLPKGLNNQESEMTESVKKIVSKLNECFPDLPIATVDERFTSLIAKKAMLSGGMRKSERRKKENVDKISATLILQSYLEMTQNRKLT